MSSKSLPRHIAIIMDGNGRWAKKHLKPRAFGHRAGVKSVSRTVRYCVKNNIPALTLFAFSTENWSRPKQEVGLLMELFIKAIQDEIASLHKNQVRLKIIGDTTAFPEKLQQTIIAAEQKTNNNKGLQLNIAANYGGRWDIVQGIKSIISDTKQQNIEITEEVFSDYLSLSDTPPLDLFIRTGGETRISNFLLWQLAYAELYFTDIFWPDFDETALEIAIQYFQKRERRFGKISEQLPESSE